MRTLCLIMLIWATGCRTKDNNLELGNMDDTAKGDTSSVDSGDTQDTATEDADEDGSPASEDCDDSDPLVNPSADEVCDGIDNDCDGVVDEDAINATTFYVDADGDGYGNASVSEEACEAPDGFVSDNTDCDDADAAFHPGADESDCTDGNDYNCDGSVGWADEDGDGFAACEDCDDTVATTSPIGIEVCDGADNDCDGTTDNDDAIDAGTWYADTDGDGYGDAAAAYEACSAPSAYVADDSDCDDTNAAINAAATEACDGVDNDCDGSVDEDGAANASTWYLDYDSDGYGGATVTTTACTAPSFHVADSTDCDDTNANIHPGAVEECDGLDNDCNSLVDDDDPNVALAPLWYADTDGDGYGDASSNTPACNAPTGFVADTTDCDDTNPESNPGAPEICDGLDNDCDVLVDNDAIDTATWYLDYDSDGYGGDLVSTVACSAPSHYVGTSGDCDDTNAAAWPGADEVCDGADNDCDGYVDDDDPNVLDPATWYLDYDQDGYGGGLVSATACSAPSFYVADSSDCVDTDATVYPGAPETCAGVDNDCDGDITSGWQDDADGDGVSNCADSTLYAQDFTSTPSGWSTVDLGGGNAPTWTYTSAGTLYEASNAALSIALSPDLGEADAYTIGVDILNGASANNHSGIVFGYTDSGNYWFLRWNDPTNWYQTGADVSLIQVVGGSAATLAQDDGSLQLYTANSQWIPMTLQVTETAIIGTWNGSEVINYTHSQSLPLGLDQVGLYTYDNDGGVTYDNLVITNP